MPSIGGWVERVERDDGHVQPRGRLIGIRSRLVLVILLLGQIDADIADVTRVRLPKALDTLERWPQLVGELIERLNLPRTGETAIFETAIGRVSAESPIFRARVRVQGREAEVLLSAAEGGEESGGESDEESDDEDSELDAQFGFDRFSDEALLGHNALAALGLAVDCRNRRLVPLPEVEVRHEVGEHGVESS